MSNCITPLQSPKNEVIKATVCGMIGCEYVSGITRTTTVSMGIKTIVYTDTTGEVVTLDKEVDCVPMVQVVNADCPEDDITVIGVACDGSTVEVIAPQHQVIQTIPHPTAVQKTSSCDVDPTLTVDCNGEVSKRVTDECLTEVAKDILTELQKPRFDVEVTNCTDGVDEWITVFNKNELVNGLPTITYLNLTTNISQATKPANLVCAVGGGVETSELVACLNGVEVSGFVIIKDKETSPTVISELWRDPATNTWGALPAGAVVGKCQTQTLIPTDVHWCYDLACVNAINWFDEATGILVKTTDPLGDVLAIPAGVKVESGVCPDPTKLLEYAYYKEAGTASPSVLLTKATGFTAGFNGGMPQATLSIQPPFSVPFEVVITIDGVTDTGNSAGAIWGANYPTNLTSATDLANYLNNSPLNTAPKDIWEADLVGDSVFIPATAGGLAPNHVWGFLGVAQSPSNSGGDAWFKHGNIDTGDFQTLGTAGASTCRKIEVIKTTNVCDTTVTLAGYELDGTLIVGFDPKLIVAGDKATVSKRLICITKADDLRYTVEERIVTTPCGDDLAPTYWDMEQSPPVEVLTADITCFSAIGQCVACDDCGTTTTALVNKKVYLADNTGLVTLASIVASLPANAVIESALIKQATGTGKVVGDSGSGVSLKQSEVYSWSVADGNQLASLSMSALTFDANGGEQRISVIYYI